MSKITIEQLFFEEMKLQRERSQINIKLREIRSEKAKIFTQYTLELNDTSTNQEGGKND